MPNQTTTDPGILTYIIERAPVWFIALIVIMISIYAARLISARLNKYISGKETDEKTRELLLTATRISHIVVLSLGIAIALNIVGLLGNLGWLLGSIGLGLGFGLKNVVGNFISGIGILLQDRTNVGDIIEMGPYLGKIVEIGVRTTIIRQLDGIEVIVPNSEFFSQIVKVYTANPFRRLNVTLGVGYDTDFTLAEKIARDILDARPDVEKKPDPLFLVTSVDNSTVQLTLKFWVRSTLPWWSIESEVLKDWFVKSQAAGIDISFPVTTLRIDNRESGLLGDYMQRQLKQ